MMASNNTRVIYAAIFGDYEGLLPQRAVPGWDYICFTDNPQLNVQPWHIRVVEPPVPGDPVRSSRYIKTQPHRFLSHYDTSIYVDGNILVVGNIDNLVYNNLADSPIVCFDHSQNRQDPRDCVYAEHESLRRMALEKSIFKDDLDVMQQQISMIRSTGYPARNGLVHSAVLLRKHNDSQLINVMERWWHMIKHYSLRDQLSFNYVLWEHGLTYAVIPGDLRRGNGYFYMLGRHRKDWSSKLQLFRLKEMLGMIKRTR